jgi:flagellar assembly protein FliH
MSRALSITELAEMLERAEATNEASGFDARDFNTGAPFHETTEPDKMASPETGAQLHAEQMPSGPRHFAPDPDIARALGMVPQPSNEDPIRQAWKSGFEDGVATEKRLAREMQGEDTEILTRIGDQVHQIDAAARQMLESRMREAVVSLCRQVIDECPIDADRLAARIQTAVRLFAAAHNEKTVEVNPADLKLLGGLLPAEWKLVANAEMARSAIRVLTPEGGVEDGPEQWKLALEEAIRTC